MKIHVIFHVEFEGLGYISDWIEENNHKLTSTKFYNNEKLPKLDTFDMLIVMGGPMGIYDYQENSWLKEEKKFIKDCIEQGKKVLGICLGAQLLADVMGVKVNPGKYKEIGWYPIYNLGNSSYFFDDEMNELEVFHWHGDTFGIPDKATHIFESKGCKNQAFEYKNRILGLQFHLEMNMPGIKRIIKNGEDELKDGKYISKKEDVLEESNKKIEKTKKILYSILNKF